MDEGICWMPKKTFNMPIVNIPKKIENYLKPEYSGIQTIHQSNTSSNSLSTV